jgi:hypothetical protein
MTTIASRFKTIFNKNKINCGKPIYFIYLDGDSLNIDLHVIIDNEETILKYKYIGRSTLELNTVDIDPKFKNIPRILELTVLYQEHEKNTDIMINKYVFSYIVFDHPINNWNRFLLKNNITIVTSYTNVFPANKISSLTFNREIII